MESTAGTTRLIGGSGAPAVQIGVYPSANGVLLGGYGGNGVALSGAGADATATSAAEAGKDAEARGGTGGDLGFGDVTVLVGGSFAGQLDNPAAIELDGLLVQRPGNGGRAAAAGGNGGSGSTEFSHGANAGTSWHFGGDAGQVVWTDDRSGLPIGSGGDGGDVILGIDFLSGGIFGDGGAGWSDCRVGDIRPGGRGGGGSVATGSAGQPSALTGPRAGQLGTLHYNRIWGNGGNGGDGVGIGTGWPGTTRLWSSGVLRSRRTSSAS